MIRPGEIDVDRAARSFKVYPRESRRLKDVIVANEKGAFVLYADPWVPRLDGHEWAAGFDMEAVELTAEQLRKVDCVVITTDHTGFDYAQIVREAGVVVDTRNAIKGEHPNVFKLGSGRRAQQTPAGVA